MRTPSRRPSLLLPAAFLLAVAGAALAGVPTNARAECSRGMLRTLTDTYVKAQSSGKPGLLPLAKGASYAENDKAMDIGQGVVAGPLKVDFTRSFLDTTQCATFTEVVAAGAPHPYVIHTRMEVTPRGKVSKIESVVSDAGDWMFGATEHLAVTRAQNWGEIPKDKRDTRAVIKAAADAYLDNWGNPALPVPHGTPCNRLEGRIDTGARKPEANTCDMGAFPQKLKVTHRRYVIDETIGAVSIFHNLPWLDAGLPVDPGTQASQMFRIENGKTRYIHEVTICAEPGCGRLRPGGPVPPPAPPPGAKAASPA